MSEVLPKNQARPTPLMLVIMDGWGYREETEHNAIAAAHTPNWDKLWQESAHGLLDTSGLAVGLPEGQMGNSEVGHLSLGSGRVVYQDYTRITKAIEDDELVSNPALCAAMDAAQANDGAVHLMGLLSPGGVHAHEDHLFAAVRMAAARGMQNIVVHAFLDGRDMPPRSAEASLQKLQTVLDEVGGRLGSVCGRYYAMDRDARWDRIQAAYELMAEGKAEFTAESGEAALAAAYARDENDEFVQPTVIKTSTQEAATVQAGDALIFMNYRADRARELTSAFVEKDFSGFARVLINDLHFVALTEYQAGMNCPAAYPPIELPNVLGEVLADNDLKQLRIAETEKYAHVTFFFNGGVETPFTGEDRELIPSPKVATYDLQPEMHAELVTDGIVRAIESNSHDVIMVNYANPDMVGHTGVFSAAVKAVEAIDECLGRLVTALTAAGGEMLITADHGNVELMHDDGTGQAHTAHTTFTVPLVYFGREATVKNGALCDIAPTMLNLLGVDVPADMTGDCLVQLHDTTAADAA